MQTESTDSSDIRMFNPWLEDQRPNTMNDNNCVVILSSNGLNEGIATMPRGEVFP